MLRRQASNQFVSPFSSLAALLVAGSMIACGSGDDSNDPTISGDGDGDTTGNMTPGGDGDTTVIPGGDGDTTNPGTSTPGDGDGDTTVIPGGDGDTTVPGGDGDTVDPPTTAAYTGACESSLTVYPEDGYVFDFEDPAMGATADDLTGWNFFDDGTADAMGSFQIVADAAAETEKALLITGDGFTDWGQGTNTPVGCVDVSGFTGVSFWAKASTTDSVLFKIEIPEQGNVLDNADEGDCTPDPDSNIFCYDHPYSALSLSSEWTQYTIPFSSLRQNGTPNPWTGVIVGLQWAFEGSMVAGSSHEVWIDEVAFYTGTAPAGRVREPEVAEE